MLQALFHNKLGRAIQDGSFHGIEDTLTSSVIGLLQYLPDSLFWKVLRESCGSSGSTLPEDSGCILGVHFWKRMGAEGTYNTQSVEPDVWIETENYDVIIEAKRSDSSGDNSQSFYQWFNEIVALGNSYGGRLEKELLFIAIGGNESLRDQVCTVNGKDFIIHTASWFDLLGAVQKLKSSCSGSGPANNVNRLLDDIIEALQYHDIFHTVWFDTFQGIDINVDAVRYLNESWVFDSKEFLSKLGQEQTILQIDSLSGIWTIK